ncbi:MAG: glycosyltransferase, partial [Pirellulales bacterium]
MRANLRFDQAGGANRRFRPSDVSALLAAPAPSATRQPKVLLAGKLTAMAAPGGGETQLLAMAQALPQAGVAARLWRPWEDSLAGADCLHLFGSLPEHLELAAAARHCGVPVALSTIAWFDLPAVWSEPRPWPGRLLAAGKFLARSACPRIPSWRRKLYQSVDLLLPNSRLEAAQLVRYFGIPKQRIQVIPNGADLRFADASPAPFARLAGGRGFVLYAGRIEPRKNQLGFLRAMQSTNVPIVMLGDVVLGMNGT